ncbi:DUF6480 family protein [Streptomyces coffeae]|uniref:Uncharacterized protein n=1 Tax=Streptomyces coffeae TaxID=621382 RepID=A0ABS1NGL8_9ACTN|nr:DUF6480 family protein [Streptomyces coffeae]MBL1099252.1 hypothetical protein [Streptomyces coffeae]
MGDRNPEPEPRRTSEPAASARGVPPGETPPAEGSTADAGPLETYNPTKGWSKGPIFVILVLVVFFVAFCIAFAAAV